MKHFENGGMLVETVDELPKLAGAKKLYADFETSSRDPKLKSTNPWWNCWVAGVGVSTDATPGKAWYVPTGHAYGTNLPQEAVIDWWLELLETCGMWVNHNVKYDAHVSTNCWGILPELPLRCTLTRAKIIDSDRLQFGLDFLSSDWLKTSIIGYYDALQPYLNGNKDYGQVPADIMGAYCCQDVLTNKQIDKYIDGNLPEQCNFIAGIEEKITTVLFEMERVGLPVKVNKLRVKELQIYTEMFKLDEELTAIVGRSFRPHVGDDVFDVLCNQYGLPVLAWGDELENGTRNPSFDKHAMAQYEAHPYAPKDVVKKIGRYRKLDTLKNFFVKKYQELAIDGRLHSSYNQMVRTGRLSGKDPNPQQLSGEAKELIECEDGMSMLSIDYSQIEFRFIVHYIQDPRCVKAYNENPDTDFHEWVAEMIGIHRKPAKTINFLMAFGGGKEKLLAGLESNMELVGNIKTYVDKLIEEGKVEKSKEIEVFKMLARRKAEDTYNTYHSSLPSLKRTSRDVARVAKMRGYVFNIAGRRRHLPETRAHIAFNTINQGGAADLMKERTVAAQEACRGTPIDIIASVHDETLFYGPTEIIRDPRTVRDLVNILEHPLIPLRVPIRCAYGISEKNWKEACKGITCPACKGKKCDACNKKGVLLEPAPLHYDPKECEDLKWLKNSARCMT